MSFAHLREDDDCHYVQGPDGREIRIAKSGLSEATTARIRGYARGGVVLSNEEQAAADAWALQMRRAAGSGEPTDVLPPVDPGSFQQMLGNPPPSVVDTGAADRLAALQELAAVPPADPFLDLTRPSTAQPFVPDPIVGGSGRPVLGTVDAGPQAPGIAPAMDLRTGASDTRRFGLDTQGVPPAAPGGLLALAAPFAALANGAPLAAPGAPLAAPGIIPAAPGEAVPIPVEPPPPLPGMEPGAPSSLGPVKIDPTLAAGFDQQKQAALDLAAVQSDEAAAKAAAAEASRVAQEAFDAETARQQLARQAQADTMRTEIIRGDVDPDRLYNSLDGAQKMALGISLFLGGFGAALTGGPNQALAIFNKRIDDDLNAQEKNLDTKKGLLAKFIDEGASIRQARELARAHMLDGIAATMERDAAKFGGLKAQSTAKTLGGALTVKAAEARADAVKGVRENQLRVSQIRATDAEAALRRAQAGEHRSEVAAKAQMRKVIDDLVAGGPVDPRVIEMLPESIGKRVVQTTPGNYALASSSEGAKAIETAQTMNSQMKAMTKEYAAIRARHPHGWITGLGDYEDKGRAQTLYSALTTKLKDVLNLGVMSDSDRELLQKQIPNLVDFSPTAKYDAQLAQLDTNIDRALSSVYDAHLRRTAIGERAEKIRPGGG